MESLKMGVHFPDVIGFAGVILILVSYFLLQISVIKADTLSYSVTNVIGAVLMLYSLYFQWNFSAIIVEIFWFCISLYGTIKALKKRRAHKS